MVYICSGLIRIFFRTSETKDDANYMTPLDHHQAEQ